MRLEQLRYLIAVAAQKSINKAAETLYITQQSLNNSMNALENELNLKLLDRSHRGVKLTTQGKIVYETALQIVALWDNMENQLSPQREELPANTPLRLCTSPRIYEFVIPKFINTYQALYPMTPVSCIKEKPSDIASGNIAVDHYDLIFSTAYFKGNTALESYNTSVYSAFTPLFEQKVFLICSKHSEVAQLKYITINHLKKLPLRGYATKETIDLSQIALTDFLRRLGIQQRILYIDSISFCLQGLLDNIFYLLCSRGPLTQLFNHPDLMLVPVKLPFKIATGYLHVQEKTLNPHAQHFVDLIADTVAQDRLSSV